MLELNTIYNENCLETMKKIADNIISEFCFTGYEDNKKPSAKLFNAIRELVCEVEENAKLKAEIEQLKQRLEVKDYNFELYSDALDEIERLKAELEQSVNKIKKKILSRRWVCTNDANPIEVLGMDWANKMNDWCIEIVEEAEQQFLS